MPASQGPTGERIAVYPGSFDPMTKAHIDLAERASHLFDRVIVAIGQHPTKPGFFSTDERMALARASTSHLPNLEVAAFSGLVVEFCRSRGASAIIRGLRAVGDFEAEFRMGLANRDLAPEIETIFLLPLPHHQFISSSLVREIGSLGGDYTAYVSPSVAAALQAKFAPR